MATDRVPFRPGFVPGMGDGLGPRRAVNRGLFSLCRIGRSLRVIATLAAVRAGNSAFFTLASAATVAPAAAPATAAATPFAALAVPSLVLAARFAIGPLGIVVGTVVACLAIGGHWRLADAVIGGRLIVMAGAAIMASLAILGLGAWLGAVAPLATPAAAAA